MQRVFPSLVPPQIIEELSKLYLDATPLIELWDSTQIREPYGSGEVEDLFFGLEGGD